MSRGKKDHIEYAQQEPSGGSKPESFVTLSARRFAGWMGLSLAAFLILPDAFGDDASSRAVMRDMPILLTAFSATVFFC